MRDETIPSGSGARRWWRTALVGLKRTAWGAVGLVLLGGGGPPLGSLAGPGPIAPDVEVTWSPERPVQGTLLLLEVRPDPARGLASVSGTVGGEELRFESGPYGTLTSLAPVPVDAADSVVARLTLAWEDGSSEDRSISISVTPGDFRHEALTVAPELGSPLSAANRARLNRDIARAAAVSRAAMDTPRLWGPTVVLPRPAQVTSGFGDGRVFNGQVSSRHMGLDLDGERGDTVRAATRGVVELVAGFLLAGNIVYLNHGGGLLSGYFHLSEQLVAEGDTVEAGQPIGRVGATGRVTGPHLHWVVRYGRTSVDPRSLLEVGARRAQGGADEDTVGDVRGSTSQARHPSSAWTFR